MPPVKDFSLPAFLPFRLNRLAAEVSRRLSSVYMDRFGLDIPDWRVLATLHSRKAATAQAIVASTRTHKSTISRAVAKLTEQGLVERLESDADGREIVLRLTAGGRALMRRLTPLVLDGEAALLAALDEREQAQLDALLRRLEASLGLDDEERSA